MAAAGKSPGLHEHPNRAKHTYSGIVATDNARVHYGDIYNILPPQSQSLDFGRLETRFLSIKSAPRRPGLAAEVSCTLETKSLFESPGYVALSYSWGDHNATRPILLDGKVTEVTTSLEVALKELLARGVEVAWVDALCIDQKNNYEKVYQLRQMGTIFSKAAKVVAWLGPAADESDDAMKLLPTMSKSDDVDQHGPAVLKLLQRPYWERVWIIQEIAKASKVEVWCGSQMLTWDVFIQGVQHWMSTSKLCGAEFNHPITALKQFCDAERNSRRGAARMLLSTAMIRTLHAKATLKRDKIYALLGMTRDGSETVSTPNYVQDDTTVFNSVLEHMIVEQGQLDLMLLGGLARKREPPPSWLPTWTDKMSLQVSPWISRCFRDSLVEDVAVERHAGDLKLRGQILGKIQARTGTATNISAPGVPHGEDVLWYTAQRAVTHLFHIERQLRLCNEPIPIDSELNSRDSLRAHVLAVFWCSPADTASARCPRLRQWFHENADMLYAHNTLRSSVEDIQANIQADIRNNIRNGSVTFKYRFTPGGPSVDVPLEVDKWVDFPQIWAWLEGLETSLEIMSRHGVELRSTEHLERRKLAMVPRSTQAGDLVARIAGCSLPVVLREVSGPTYCLVGEVVEIPKWEELCQREEKGYAESNRKYASEIGALGLWYGFHSIEWRTLHLV